MARNGRRGFTLVELLVVITIFVFMTAIVIQRYGTFNQSTIITNLAYDVALVLRTAQTYGVSVKNVTDSSNNQNYNYSYGIQMDFETGTNPTSLFMYADTNNNKKYDNGTDIVLNTYNLTQGAYINKAVLITNGNTYAGHTLDVVFQRPDPSPWICDVQGGVLIGGACTRPGTIYVYLYANDGATYRVITINPNGQIAVIRQNGGG